MKKILVVFIIMCLCCQNIAYGAVTTTVSLSETKAEVGDSVTVSGYAEAEEWVSIKIIDEDGSVVYFNVVKADDTGEYEDELTVPDVSVGTLDIVVGSGTDVVTAELAVYEDSDDNDDDDEDEDEDEDENEDEDEDEDGEDTDDDDEDDEDDEDEDEDDEDDNGDGTVTDDNEGTTDDGAGATDEGTPQDDNSNDKEENIVDIDAKVTVDENTNQAHVVVNPADLNAAFTQNDDKQEGENDDDDDGETEQTKIIVDVVIPEGIPSFDVSLPKSVLQNDLSKKIVVSTNIGTVNLSGDMINTGENSTGTVSLTFKNINKEEIAAYNNVDDQMKAIIGDRPVIEISLMENGETVAWENQDSPVKISIPYTLQDGEDPEHIVVYYIDGEGKANEVSNGRYNTETGLVEFNVYHFSTYAVAYVETTFNDLGNYSWAKHQIEVLASKGIINGVGDGKYAPANNIKRADFVLLLVNTLELYAEFDANFDDVSSSDYYAEAVGVAKALGITSGVGDNNFAPKEDITREDMMVMTYNALMLRGLIGGEVDVSVLDEFNDLSDIAPYALDSIASLVENYLITGSNKEINPKGYTTRAETAVLLYRLYYLGE